MAEETKVLFTDEQIENYSKFLDGLFDFKKLISKKVTILWVFKLDVGSILENYDRTVYVNLFKMLNEMYADGKISSDLGTLISNVLDAFDAVDTDKLIDVLATEIAGKVDILSSDTQEEALIKAALTTLSTLKPDLLTYLHTLYLKVQATAE